MRKRKRIKIDHGNMPYYDRKKHIWKLVEGTHTEEGDLTYITCEYLRTSLYYPYDAGPRMVEDFEPHEHDFGDLLAEVYRDPEQFTIEGREEYYSAQEAKLISKLREKLLEAKRKSDL